ncbi:ESPR-type extended signal peptide-containing protein, partial [Acinetobacter sp. NIPH 2699]|uniref:ESPR-type extended signal peptide-containing protein n=1 Tax=Acinetobacter sp. NIPH 2699 TaxID=2923433 RepID=UPI002408408D
MNKVYKVVWNASLGVWVAVSELAKSKTKNSGVSDTAGKTNNLVASQQAKLFFLKPLSFAIFSILIPSFAFAEVNTGGGTSTQTSSTAISPTNAQCGVLNQAAITGTSTHSTAIGCGTTISNAADSVAIGKQNTINATNATSQQIADRRGGATPVNYPTGQTGYTSASVSIGTLNSTGAGGGVAIGNGNQVEGDFHGVAVGQGNRTTNGYAVGLGIGNLASGTSSLSIGTANQATGNTAIAMGRQSYSKADFGIAIGNIATVEAGATKSIAIGDGANASVENSVSLGGGSTTTAQSGNSFLTNVAPSATNGVVSVGTTGATRRIQNVADGAALNDAVNVAQLDKAYDDTHSRLATALGGGAAYNSTTNAYTAPTYNVTTDPAAGTKTGNVNNVGAALSGLDTAVNKAITFNGNTGTSSNKLGSSLNITGGLTGASSNTNVKTVVSGNTLDIQIADAPTFTGTVTAGNLTTGGALTVTGASNLNGGANLNNQKITNLADGSVATGSKEAVNGGQLKTVSDVANTASTTANTANTTANTALTNADNAQTTANTALTDANNAQITANTANTTANNALTEAQKGISFGDGSTDNNFALGDTINVTGDSNITTETTVDGVQVKLNDDISVTSVTAGNSTLDTNGLVITGGPSITTAGIDAANNVISNVADGSAAGDAVNFGQLTTTNTNVTAAQNAADAAQTSADAAQSTANNALTEAQKGISFGDGSTDNNFALGDTINVTGDSNITTETTVDGVQVKLNDDISVTSVTAGNSTLDTNGLVITGGPSITTAGIDAANNV